MNPSIPSQSLLESGKFLVDSSKNSQIRFPAEVISGKLLIVRYKLRKITSILIFSFTRIYILVFVSQKMRKLFTVSPLMMLVALPLSTVAAAAAADKPISHIIVLMMENRSFDHLLGWLKSALMPGIDGLNEGQLQPRDPNDLTKGFVPVTRGGYDVPPDDPKHDYDNIATQINSNEMNGFVYDSLANGLNETNPVRMFDMASAPIINTLAMEYSVFDRWFCSVPGPTDPNRAFAMSGTSLGVLSNFDGTLYPQQSYFDYLRQHNRTFAGYYQDDLWALGYFEDLVTPENSQFIKELEPHFYDDVAAGNLADFTWLQPRMR